MFSSWWAIGGVVVSKVEWAPMVRMSLYFSLARGVAVGGFAVGLFGWLVACGVVVAGETRS